MAITNPAQAPDRVVQPEVIDTRPRWRRLVPPIATAAAVFVAAGYVSAVDPHESGHYPSCPTQWLLGIDCPGCGLMRGTYCLTHGDLGGAIDNNLLLVALVPFAAVLWVLWLRRAWRGVSPAVTARQAQVRTRWTIGVLVVVLAFGVIRNLVPFLGSGIG